MERRRLIAGAAGALLFSLCPMPDRVGRETRQRSHVACGGIYPRDH